MRTVMPLYIMLILYNIIYNRFKFCSWSIKILMGSLESFPLYLYGTILDSATYNYYYHILKFKIWIAIDFVIIVRTTCWYQDLAQCCNLVITLCWRKLMAIEMIDTLSPYCEYKNSWWLPNSILLQCINTVWWHDWATKILWDLSQWFRIVSDKYLAGVLCAYQNTPREKSHL